MPKAGRQKSAVFLVWNSDAAEVSQVACKIVAQGYGRGNFSEQGFAGVTHNGGARGVAQTNQFVPLGGTGGVA
jgi:hypothetical protein